MSCTITKNAFYHLEQKWKEKPLLRPLILLAGVITVVVTPLLLLADLTRWAYRSHIQKIPSADHHYFYSSPICSHYSEQLKSFIEKEVAQHPSLATLDLVEWVKKAKGSNESIYQGTLLRLRALINQKETLPSETVEFVERFCHWIYTEANLLPSMTQWIKGNLDSEDQQNLRTLPLSNTISILHKKWGSDPRFQGEVFQDFRPYDPRLLGDTPSHFFKLHNTQIIRTPAVTKDEKRSFFGTLNQAAIVEEFKGFIQHCEKHNRNHLYVNLMAKVGSEKMRTEALEELEKTSPALQLINLSKDCSFYHQNGPFASEESSRSFKKTFLNQMFGDNPAFHWPLSWDLETTKAQCEEAIERVHHKYFNSSTNLSRAQRQDFIEIAYAEIVETLLQENKPVTCNISCRSCVDRGAASLSILYAKTHKLQDVPSKETLLTITLAPAMLSQNRQMLSHRKSRLITALKVLSL